MIKKECPYDGLWRPGESLPELPFGQQERLEDVPDWLDYLWVPEGAGVWWEPVERFLKLAGVFVWPDGFNAGERVSFDGWQLARLIIPLHGLYWQGESRDIGLKQGLDPIELPTVGTRVHREAGLLIGRGAGKSGWASVEALVETLDVLSPRSDVGLYASSRDQASIVFDPGVSMVEAAPQQVQDRLSINKTKKTITSKIDGSIITVHTGDAKREVGRKHSTIIVDEILSQKNEELYSALKTGMGKRPNCRLIWMTTPSLDENPELFARIEVEKAEDIYNNRSLKVSFLPVIYKADKDDDPFDWATIRKANPHLDCGRLDPQVVRDEMEDARKYPSNLAAFKVFRLCMWGEGGDKFIPLDAFDDCAADKDKQVPKLSELEGLYCGIGLDLSRTTDLTCISLMWWDSEKDSLYLLWHHFASEATFQRINAWTSGGLQRWVDNKQIKMDVTGTERIDHEDVQKYLFRYANRFNAALGIDRYDAYGTLAMAEKAKIDAQALRQGTGLAHGIKLVEQQIVDRNLIHNGDPLARWCIQNAEVRYNTEGWSYLVRPEKRSSTKIIDPAVAAVMAADRIIHLQLEHVKSKTTYLVAETDKDVKKEESAINEYGIIDWDEMELWTPEQEVVSA